VGLLAIFLRFLLAPTSWSSPLQRTVAHGISGDLSSLSHLRGLKLFDIQYNEHVSAIGNLSDPSSLHDLECLRISDCPAVVGNLSSLEPLVALKDLKIEIGSIEGNISLLLPLISLQNLYPGRYCPDLNSSFTSLEPLHLRHLHLRVDNMNWLP
jgi:hypothetical protein